MSTGGGSSTDEPRRSSPPRVMAGAWAGALVLAVVLVSFSARAEASPAAGRGDAGFVEMLLRLGLAEEAGRETRRQMLSGGAESLPPDLVFRVAMSLATKGEAAAAAPLLTQAAAQVDDPKRADEWQLAAGVALLKAGELPHAIHLFARVEAFAVDERTRGQATRLRCVGEVLARNGAAARACVALLPPVARTEEIDDLVSGLEISARTRAIVGGVLSALVPGLGQLTAGEPVDALLALLVNGAWGTGVYLLIAESAFFDAALLGLGVGVRYYLGNIRNGSEAWRKAAERRRDSAARRLIRVLGTNRL